MGELDAANEESVPDEADEDAIVPAALDALSVPTRMFGTSMNIWYDGTSWHAHEPEGTDGEDN